MAQILLVDDMPDTREVLGAVLGRHGDVQMCSSAEGVRALPHLDHFTHAVIDLSHDSVNCDVAERRPNGLDVFVELDRRAPTCRRVGISVFTAPRYIELGQAVHQFWPGAPLLHKLHANEFRSSLTTFLAGRQAPNAAVMSPRLPGLVPCSDWRQELQRDLTKVGGNPFVLADVLASLQCPPSRDEVALRGHWAASTIPVRLANLRSKLK